MHNVCAWYPKKSEEGFRAPGIIAFGWFGTTTWMLGIKPGSSAWGASALKRLSHLSTHFLILTTLKLISPLHKTSNTPFWLLPKTFNCCGLKTDKPRLPRDVCRQPWTPTTRRKHELQKGSQCGFDKRKPFFLWPGVGLSTLARPGGDSSELSTSLSFGSLTSLYLEVILLCQPRELGALLLCPRKDTDQ